MAILPPRRRFTVAEYEQMGIAGILHEDDRVELIDGEILTMSPIGAPHALAVATLTHLLVRHAPAGALVFVQNPIRLPGENEPQPDLALVRDAAALATLPTAVNVPLVMEVADLSLAYDRRVKFPLYAAAGIAEAWLVDVAAGRVERHTELGPTGYGTIVSAGCGEALASTVIPALTVTVDA